MAIISIPTAVGGVNIPNALLKGPLGALFGSKYTTTSLQYPSDLGSATKGHVIQFLINEIEPITYEQTANSPPANSSDLAAGAAGLRNVVTDVFDNAKNLNTNLKPRKKKSHTSVSLYIPDTVNVTYNSSYGNLSLADVIKEVADMTANKSKNPILSVVNKFGKALSSGISAAQGNIAKLALSSQGLAINPNQQLLFDGIDFRTFQMAFTFTPHTKQEAETVKKIITAFKYHSAPEITTKGAGMFFIPPSTFDIKFLFNGKENTNINKITECVLESVDVNYAPNGWAAHDDGAPVQTTMTLSFREIELVDKTKINAGY
jgi:hypothetical protein